VADDDFDIELEQAASEAKGDAAPAKPAAEAAAEPSAEAHAMSAKKPGAVEKAKEKLGDRVAKFGRPQLTVKNALAGLVVVLAVALLAENWSAVRVNFFGAYVDVPKPVAFLVDVLIGALIMWYVGLRKPAAPAEGGEVAE
jgi:uncharacterized integral membrane protein